MLQSLIIAFSTYSKLPMPHGQWNEKTMKYSMCFFPLVGAVIGAVTTGLYYLLGKWLGCGSLMVAVVLTVVPVLVTGGIHMDGFLDTVDARCSYRSREEKLKILKDPHTGAFAIIFGMVYMLLYFGFMEELVASACNTTVFVYAISFMYIRALSGLSVVTLKKAKQDGMLAEAAKAADTHVKWVMLIWALLCIVAMLIVNVCYGEVVAAAGLLVYVYYRHMSYRIFGGITGDLAGYFLQMAELTALIALVITEKVVML